MISTFSKTVLFVIFLTTSAYARELYLPNHILTPGDTLVVSEKDLCKSGYSATVRNVPESEKKQVYEEYNMQPDKSPCPCECDHLISLEIGGSNDIRNLWPQPYSGKFSARRKDVLETHLKRLVCDGKITLKEAQEEIKGDWTKAYLKYGLDKLGNKGNIIKIVH